MSLELQALIADRNETPVLVAVQDATHDALELYRFADGTEVIVTNAGIIAEGAEGFEESKSLILA